MNLKQKILAAGLAAMIAGFGIFGANNATAQTDSNNANSTITQMMAMIESLKQQIQQIIALIAQLKPQETCGNGYCRFGETAATCPADCAKPTNDNGKDKCAATGGVWKYSDCASACVFKTKVERLSGIERACVTMCLRDYLCECPTGKYWASREEGCIAKFTTACGNGACDTYETADTCPADCKTSTICKSSLNADLCKKAGGQFLVQETMPPTTRCQCPGNICVGDDCERPVVHKIPVCGNGICETGETAINCPADCGRFSQSCVRENESFIDANRQCCSGLQKTRAACSDATCYTCKSNCAGEGQTINKLYNPLQPSTMPTSCCADLTAYSGANYTVQNGICVRKQYAVMETTAICLKCGDGICNAAAGENICGCPADCPSAIFSAACGNGVCDAYETSAACPADCGAVVGGKCTYKTYAGTCVKTDTSANGVNYTFTPLRTPDISGTSFTSASQINPYKGITEKWPIGNLLQISCTLDVITSGTCTPIIMRAVLSFD